MASAITCLRGFASLCLLGGAHGFALMHAQDNPLLTLVVQASGEEVPPEAKDVEDILKNINGSLDKVSKVVTSANSTVHSMADDFLLSITTMQNSLAALSIAANAAAKLPGAENVAAKAEKFIERANSTLDKAESQVPETVDLMSSKFADMMPGLATVADKLANQYQDALATVLDICNSSGSAVSMYSKQSKKVNRKESVHPKSGHARKHAQRTGENEEAVALLNDRVFQNRKAVSSSNVEAAVWPKKGKSSATGQATREIAQANSTLEALSDKIVEINATIASLLFVPLDAASAALDAINATVAPALSGLPSSLRDPVSGALDTLLSLRDTLDSDVQTKVSDLADDIRDALDDLAAVGPLADMLQASVDECTESNNTASQ